MNILNQPQDPNYTFQILFMDEYLLKSVEYIKQKKWGHLYIILKTMNQMAIDFSLPELSDKIQNVLKEMEGYYQPKGSDLYCMSDRYKVIQQTISIECLKKILYDYKTEEFYTQLILALEGQEIDLEEVWMKKQSIRNEQKREQEVGNVQRQRSQRLDQEGKENQLDNQQKTGRIESQTKEQQQSEEMNQKEKEPKQIEQLQFQQIQNKQPQQLEEQQPQEPEQQQSPPIEQKPASTPSEQREQQQQDQVDQEVEKKASINLQEVSQPIDNENKVKSVGCCSTCCCLF